VREEPLSHEGMSNTALKIDADLEAVRGAFDSVEPRSKRLLLFGSRARGEARPDSKTDLLVVMPQAKATVFRRLAKPGSPRVRDANNR
jgi:predicted nucleotidyltransferase